MTSLFFFGITTYISYLHSNLSLPPHCGGFSCWGAQARGLSGASHGACGVPPPSLCARWAILPVARQRRARWQQWVKSQLPPGGPATGWSAAGSQGSAFPLLQGDLQSQAMVRAVARQVCEQLIQSKWAVVTNVRCFSAKWKFTFCTSINSALSWCRPSSFTTGHH